MKSASIFVLLLATAAMCGGVASAADTPADQSSACTGVSPPARTGTRIRDQGLLMGFTISSTMVALNEPDKKGILVYPPPQWCEEQTIDVDGKKHVLWHNIAADTPNASGAFDRLSIDGKKPEDSSGTITTIEDRLAPTMHRDGDPPAPSVVFDVVLETADEIEILGSYDGPPTIDELTHFAKTGYVDINARIDKKTKNTTIYAPQ